MKTFLNSCLFILLGFVLSAQPDDFIPCHNASAHQLFRSKPSEFELQAMLNSNLRSDSFDILNYAIAIDVSNYSGKALQQTQPFDLKQRWINSNGFNWI